MSEPLGGEERARLRRKVYDHGLDRTDALALLDEVDRLTEDNAKLLAAFKREHKWRMEAEGREDAAREEGRNEAETRDLSFDALTDRAERAEADLTEAVSKLGAANVGLGQWKAKAQGLAIDLADEKRRHAETEALLRRVLDEKHIRHDHAYPMEVGSHHCAGCDLEAELRAALRPGGEDR